MGYFLQHRVDTGALTKIYLDINIINLPVEEILFFLIIPFAPYLLGKL
jgi:hypothetical protein